MTTDEMSEKIAKFDKLCKHHDLTWMWSDDMRRYKWGEQQFNEIKRLAHEIPRETAIAIWNSYVDAKIRAESAPKYYWKEEW